MAALNFPLSPENGDVHGNYVYDATEGVWNANPQQLASRFVTSATQPTSPSNGDGWLDTNTGKTYIYYNDGSSAQWIESGNPVIGFVDPYDQTTTSTGHFALPKGTSAQRPVAPENGDIRFNTELGEPEYYSESEGAWFLFRQPAISEFSLEYLVIAGGGGGGGEAAAGGGAGGYRTNTFSLNPGSYTLTVGAGGAGATSAVSGSNGADSVFSTISSTGGGGGGSYQVPNMTDGLDGGSGGGAAYNSSSSPGNGISGQGFAGGGTSPDPWCSGGGGGAGAVGVTGTNSKGGDGGVGLSSSITGSLVFRGGGGGGSVANSDQVIGFGGNGGGGNGGRRTPALAATDGLANTGGGGGGGNYAPSVDFGGTGGSGIVIFKLPSSANVSFSAGLVEANGGSGQVIGEFTVYTVTAGTGTVTFS